MVRQVAVGKRIHSPGANEHRTRCCSGHPGMVQAAAPGAYRPTENALMGFRRSVGGTTFLAMRWPRHDAENGPLACFPSRNNTREYLLCCKMLLCPLHLRMQCPESTCFCNKRGFMWVFVKAVAGHGALASLPAYPRRRYSRFPDDASAHSPAARMGRPRHTPCHFRGLCWGRSPRVPRFIC